MDTDAFIANSKPFIGWMLDWQAKLQPVTLASLSRDNSPRSIGILSVDVIEGFCTVGPLASPRVNKIVEPITQLFKDAWAYGVRDILLTQDTHPDDAVEFANYAPHCIRGTVESETVAAFKALPFFDEISVLPKNSINSGFAPGFSEWIAARPKVKTWIVVGDCTDLCTHQLAMHMRLWANQHQIRGIRVVLPVNTVDTYDLPVQTATELGIAPHDADFLHTVFLYNMMQNGIEVVSAVQA
ncbi:MAG: isochorismatase family protein [Chloroflexi bacterium]|nr:isochorismatase family protein [Chloroflexota bacterium]MCC6893548.1 isochorismatase family protein [Anaerolineae bacterium]